MVRLYSDITDLRLLLLLYIGMSVVLFVFKSLSGQSTDFSVTSVTDLFIKSNSVFLAFRVSTQKRITTRILVDCKFNKQSHKILLSFLCYCITFLPRNLIHDYSLSLTIFIITHLFNTINKITVYIFIVVLFEQDFSITWICGHLLLKCKTIT